MSEILPINIESKPEATNASGFDLVGHKNGEFTRLKLFDRQGKLKSQFVNQNVTVNNNSYALDPEQIVPSEALYNDTSETLAGDIIKRVDKNTGENVNYRETTTWHDGSAMDDSKVDGFIYVKRGVKFYVRVFNGNLNIKWFGAVGDGITDDSEPIRRAVNFAKSFRSAIFFPDGYYKVASGTKILIDYDIFQITGTGKNTSHIIFEHPDGGFLFQKPNPSDWQYKPFFMDIAILGNNTCNTLLQFKNEVSEGEFKNVTFGSCVGALMEFSSISGVLIDYCDLVNAGKGIQADNFFILRVQNSNIFNLGKALSCEYQITSLFVNITYFEKCDNILYGGLDFVGILDSHFNSIRVLHNIGSDAPFVFEKLDYASSFALSNSEFNIQYNTTALIKVNTARVGDTAYIKIDKSNIELGAGVTIDNIVNVAAGSSAYTTRLFISFTTYPSSVTNVFNSGLGMYNVIKSDTMLSASNGIQITDKHPYAGRIFYDVPSGGTFITNELDQWRRLVYLFSGTTAERPPTYAAPIGQPYFDTSLGYMIYWNGTNWVNSTGVSV